MINRSMRLLALSGIVVAGLATGQTARAGMITSASGSVGGSALAGQTYANFDARVAGSAGTQTTAVGLTVNFGTSTGMFVQGSSNAMYSAPILSGNNNLFFEATTPAGADTTVYTTTGSGAVTMSFAGGSSTYFGILWGSIDTYNSLTFNFADNTSQTFTGTQAAALAGVSANGSTTAYFNFIGTAFTSVVASSNGNAFEFDNVAFSAAVPEPSSLALCGIAGIVGLGATRLRRKQTV